MSDLYATSPETEKPIDLYADADKKAINTERIDERSFKYSVATGKTPEEVKTLLLDGKEDQLRTDAVNEDVQARMLAAEAVTKDYVYSGGEDLAYAKALSTIVPNPADTILEKQFAEKLADIFVSSSDNPELAKEISENPDEHDAYRSIMVDSIAKQEYFMKIYEEQAQKIKEMSWVGVGASFAEQAFIPLFSWANMSNEIETNRKGSLLPYSNLKEQIDYIRTRPVEEAKVLARMLVENVSQDNALQGLEVAKMLTSYTENELAFGNLFEALNIPGLVAAPKISKKLFTSILKSTTKPLVKPAKVLSSGGRITEAAEVAIKSVEEAKKSVTSAEKLPTSIDKRMADLIAEVPSWYDPDRFFTSGKASEYYKSVVPKLRDAAIERVRILGRVLDTPVNVTTLSDTMTKVGLDALRAEMKAKFSGLGDSVLAIRDIPPTNLANIAGVEVDLGKPVQLIEAERALKGKVEIDIGSGLKDNWLFDSKEQAEFTAENLYNLKPGTYESVGEADGYVIRVTKDLDETNPSVTEVYQDKANLTRNRLRDMIHLVRGQPADILPENLVQARATATASSQLAMEILGEAAEPLKRLKNPKDLYSILETNRDTPTKFGDPGSRGMFYNNIDELDDAFLEKFNRHATRDEMDAYFTAVQLHELDYVLKNLSITKDLSRQGVETVVAKIDGKEVTFSGKVLKDLPEPTNSVKVMVVEAKSGKGVIRPLSEKTRKDVKDLVEKENYTIYQNAMPLRKEIDGENTVVFLVTKDSSVKPLSFVHMPYRQGFHSKYADEFKVNIPEFEDGYYMGDKLAFYTRTEAAGKKIVEALEKARQLYRAGSMNELAQYMSKTLPISAEDLVEKYKSKEWNPESPFMLTRSNIETADTAQFNRMYPEAKRFKDTKFNLERDIDQNYRQERGEVVKGIYEDEGKGFVLKNAEQINPLVTQSRELARLTRSRYFDTLKQRTADVAIENFGPLMMKEDGVTKVTPQELKRNPVYWLNHAVLSKDATILQKGQLWTIRNSFRRLVGQPNAIEKNVNTFVYRLLEPTLSKLGIKKLPGGMEIPLIRNGVDYMRAMAFYTKMGFYNPVQFLVQASGSVVAQSMHPLLAMPSSVATTMMRRLSLTESEDVIRHAARAFAGTKIPGGFSEDAFVDSFKWLKKTGFDLIKGQHSYSDFDVAGEVVTKGTIRKLLDKSTFFFQEGERFNNMNAWNIAYLEYTKKNKKAYGKLTAADAEKVHTRARTLSGMMQRDFQAHYQDGILNLPTQFYGYYARMVDLAIGTRLTPVEKMKLVTGFGLMFGSNYAASLLYAVQEGAPDAALNQFIPYFGEGIRARALRDGVDINKGFLGFLANGVPATALGFIMADTPNYGERYGLGGSEELLRNLKDAMKESDVLTAIFMAAGGASANITTEIVRDIFPLAGELSRASEMSLEAAMEHLKRLGSNISTVSTGAKAFDAITTGVYYSKNGARLAEDIPTLDAIINGLSGMQPQTISDGFRASEVAKKLQKHKQAAIKEVTPLVHNMYEILRTEGTSERFRDLSRAVDVRLRAAGMTPSEVWEAKIRIMSENDLVSEDALDKLIGVTGDLDKKLKLMEMKNGL